MSDSMNMGNTGNTESTSMITGSFRDRDSAERAYESLRARGYSDKDIHMIMSDETRKKNFAHDKHDKGVHEKGIGNKAMEGAGVGGAVGGAIGATLMAIAAAGAAVAVPGVGLVVAGPLAGALAGGAAGAATGGIAGMLIGAGIPEDRAKLYDKDIREGNIVMGVRPRNTEDAEYLDREWQPLGTHIYR